MILDSFWELGQPPEVTVGTKIMKKAPFEVDLIFKATVPTKGLLILINGQIEM